ncbi:copper amine oxidase N-terminal domain-containing protein [Tindallia californiensis]|uniref:Copper amine oxidase N-terminal domain-containing protein n=1 Tax=Tindallia californiensis TaxID=159292 RepID=A0A1H3PEW3_9FIRM|nr:copper amine oxidase N-terminal domain-containing protein [Tindallia californiensis]SDY99588.1 Copper amine oxidase N-terminal domain-containing protein [Tindallia californiensis]
MNKRGLLAVLLVFMLVFSSFAVYADEHMEDEVEVEEQEEAVEAEANGEVDTDEEEEATEADEEVAEDVEEATEEEAVEENDEIDEEATEEEEAVEEDEAAEETEEEMEEEVVAAERIQLNLGNNIAIIDGEHVEVNPAPYADENGRTMVPLSFVGRQLGASFDWDADARQVTYTKDETVILLTIDSNIAVVNGEEVEMDTVAVILEGRTVVPVSFISRTLGFDVDWNGETQTVVITPAVEGEEEAADVDEDADAAEEMDEDEATEEAVEEETVTEETDADEDAEEEEAATDAEVADERTPYHEEDPDVIPNSMYFLQTPKTEYKVGESLDFTDLEFGIYAGHGGTSITAEDFFDYGVESSIEEGTPLTVEDTVVVFTSLNDATLEMEITVTE